MSTPDKKELARIAAVQAKIDRASCNDCVACSRAIEEAEAAREYAIAHAMESAEMHGDALDRIRVLERERDEDRHEIAAMIRQRADTLAEDALEPEDRDRNLPAARELLSMASRVEGGCNAEASDLQVLIEDHAKVTVFLREVQTELAEARRWAEMLRDSPGSFWSNDEEFPWDTEESQSAVPDGRISLRGMGPEEVAERYGHPWPFKPAEPEQEPPSAEDVALMWDFRPPGAWECGQQLGWQGSPCLAPIPFSNDPDYVQAFYAGYRVGAYLRAQCKGGQ